MWARVMAGILLAISTLLAHGAQAEDDAALIAKFVVSYQEKTYLTRSSFEHDLFAELRANPDVAAVAASLSTKYDLPAPQIERFIRLWLRFDAIHLNSELLTSSKKPQKTS